MDESIMIIVANLGKQRIGKIESDKIWIDGHPDRVKVR